MIAADVRNNSAWNQRMFALKGKAGVEGVGRDVTREELAMARAYILCAPNNEAPWAYVSGLAGVVVLPEGDGGVGRATAALASIAQFGDLAHEVGSDG